MPDPVQLVRILGLGWNRLRNWGESRLIRTSFLWLLIVPALARLLHRLPESIQVTVLDAQWTLTLALPFRWRLFYLMAVAFAAAQLAYLAWCPTIVRRHRLSKELPPQHVSWMLLAGALLDGTYHPAELAYIDKGLSDCIHSLRLKRTETNREHEPLFQVDPHGALNVPVVISQLNDAARTELLTVVVAKTNRQKPIAILIATGFFAIGGSLFVWLAAESFWSVVSTML